jgi:hypothetical protein
MEAKKPVLDLEDVYASDLGCMVCGVCLGTPAPLEAFALVFFC